MLSGNITNNNYYEEFSKIAQVNCNNRLEYYYQLFPEESQKDNKETQEGNDETLNLPEQYDNYYDKFVVKNKENINIAPNGTIVFN
jgi:hypothetical protein